MEVYQASPQYQQHPPLQQAQYYPNPFVDDVEKPGSIRSGHLHPNPHSPGQSTVNLAYNQNLGYPSPMTPGTPVNYPAAHKVPLTSHVSSSASSGGHNKMGGAGSEKSIIKVQTRMAGCIFVIIVILFAAVIGLAAGLGMTQEVLRQTRSDLLLAQAKLVAPGTGNTSPTTASPPSTVTVPHHMPAPSTTGSTPSPTAIAAIKCPEGNGTFYTTGDSSSGEPRKQFQRLCGIDYGQGEAKDIGSKKVASLDDCLDACAAKEGCTGAGWGVIGGDKGNLHSCWMKNGLIKFHKATPEWGFGRLITGTEDGAGNGEGEGDGEKDSP